jgi:mannose-6-phosphate isomerase-like protein (cupin superfamily)
MPRPQSSFGRLRSIAFTIAGFWVVTQLQQQHAARRPSFNGVAHFEDSPFANGTRYRIARRANETRGAFVTAELLIRPGAPGWYAASSSSASGGSSDAAQTVPAGAPPLHSHPYAQSVVVKRGRMQYVAGSGSGGGSSGPSAPKFAEAGETVVFASGEPHTYGNPSASEDLLIEITLAPAPKKLGERVFESYAGLAHAYGGAGARGVPALHFALLAADAGVTILGKRRAVEAAEKYVLPRVARVLGYRSQYPEFDSGSAADAAEEEEGAPAAAAAAGSGGGSAGSEEL